MNTAADTRPQRSPLARYVVRLSIGVALYFVTIFLAVQLQESGTAPWLLLLMNLPSVAVIAWSIISFYRESDEFAQRQLGESFITGFAIGVPLLLAIGLLEILGGPHLNGMIAFGIMMTGWFIGSMVTVFRYRAR